MKGYYTHSCYMGYIPNKGYCPFVNETDYEEEYNETIQNGEMKEVA